jgi:hypothetical protein
MLYRHPLDFIVSAVEASRWGYGAYGFLPFVGPSAGNIVAGLAEYWINRTERMIAFEEGAEHLSCRIHYEVLVSVPEALVNKLLDFLGLEPVPGIVEMAMTMRHERGPADYKVDFTDAVSTASVGKGRSVPLELIAPTQRERMATLLEKLGYPTLAEQSWPPADAEDRGCDWTDIEELIKGRLSARLACMERPDPSLSIIAFSVSRGPHVLDKVIDLMERRVADGVVMPLDAHVSVTAEGLLQIADGSVNLGAAWRNGTLKVSCPRQEMLTTTAPVVLETLWALVKPG